MASIRGEKKRCVNQHSPASLLGPRLPGLPYCHLLRTFFPVMRTFENRLRLNEWFFPEDATLLLAFVGLVLLAGVGFRGSSPGVKGNGAAGTTTSSGRGATSGAAIGTGTFGFLPVLRRVTTSGVIVGSGVFASTPCPSGPGECSSETAAVLDETEEAFS